MYCTAARAMRLASHNSGDRGRSQCPMKSSLRRRQCRSQACYQSSTTRWRTLARCSNACRKTSSRGNCTTNRPLLICSPTIWQPCREAVLRDRVINHMIHHRGQLTVYLRLLDRPVPGMYGPSPMRSSPHWLKKRAPFLTGSSHLILLSVIFSDKIMRRVTRQTGIFSQQTSSERLRPCTLLLHHGCANAIRLRNKPEKVPFKPVKVDSSLVLHTTLPTSFQKGCPVRVSPTCHPKLSVPS